jgi:hypothetical protein
MVMEKEKIMTRKRFWLGMLVMVLVFGMTVVGCGEDPADEPHKITITGLGGKTGSGVILLYSSLDASASGVVAGWQGKISGSSVTASLQGVGGGAWTGSGKHHILMQIGDEVFAYTNGQTLEQLGISTDNDFYTKMPKYNITGSTTTIAFNKFSDVSGI